MSKLIGRFDNTEGLSSALKTHISDLPFIVCIGTDRNSGDALGPFVGTYLKEKGYDNVIGTLEHPVHAQNLEENIRLIPEGATVLAIDACLGHSVGKHIFQTGSIKAGSGVGKELPDVGDFSIKSVINTALGGTDSLLDYFTLSNTRLFLVTKMAKQIVEAIESAFPIENKVLEFINS